jgi:hypothetical protein
MTQQTKKRKKVQLLQQQAQVQKQEQSVKAESAKEELAGSTQYLTDQKFDKILKQYREEIKVENVQHNQSKKQIIIRTAQQMEAEGYPVNQICDRISKSSKGLGYADRYVRMCLDDKYKNPIKSAEALNQKSTVADQKFHDQQELQKKDLKDNTVEDIKAANVTQLRKLCKTHMQKGDFWERIAKQYEDKAKDWEQQAKQWEEKAKQWEKDQASMKEFSREAEKLSDAEVGKRFKVWILLDVYSFCLFLLSYIRA